MRVDKVIIQWYNGDIVSEYPIVDLFTSITIPNYQDRIVLEDNTLVFVHIKTYNIVEKTITLVVVPVDGLLK